MSIMMRTAEITTILPHVHHKLRGGEWATRDRVRYFGWTRGSETCAFFPSNFLVFPNEFSNYTPHAVHEPKPRLPTSVSFQHRASRWYLLLGSFGVASDIMCAKSKLRGPWTIWPSPFSLLPSPIAFSSMGSSNQSLIMETGITNYAWYTRLGLAWHDTAVSRAWHGIVEHSRAKYARVAWSGMVSLAQQA